MKTSGYRIESTSTVSFRLMPGSTPVDHLYQDRATAIAMAAKAATDPPGQEICVVHVPSGQVVFRKQADLQGAGSDR
jgi:hypothetical protein